MYEINCYDSYGNTIDYLTQWDYNRKLVMYIDNYDLSYAPEVHFCNQNSKEALVVQSIVEDNKVAVDIPNILLQEHLPLFIYIYLSDANNASSQKTIFSLSIPVRYRPKPSEYTYIENIHRITAATIEESVFNKLKDNLLMIRSAEQTTKAEENDGINIYTITLTDGTTSSFEVKNGSVGKSAYEYAKEGGYIGTEEEYREMTATIGGIEALIPDKATFEDRMLKVYKSSEKDDEADKELFRVEIQEDKVTNEDVKSALGYTPASEDYVAVERARINDELAPLQSMNGCIVCNGEEITLVVGEDVVDGQVINFKYKLSDGYSVGWTAPNSICIPSMIPPVMNAGYGEASETIDGTKTSYTFTGCYFVAIRPYKEDISQLEELVAELISKTKVEDITNDCLITDSDATVTCKHCNGEITINYINPNTEQYENKVLMKLPEKYRPKTYRYIAGMIGTVPATFRVYPDGDIVLWSASSYTGRIVFDCVIAI